MGRTVTISVAVDRIHDIVYVTDVADIQSEITALDAPPAVVQEILKNLAREFRENVEEAQMRVDDWKREKARRASRLDALKSLLVGQR